jgi:hypothetical protein
MKRRPNVSEILKYSMNFQIVRGASLSIPGEIKLEGYEKIQVAVAASATSTITLPSGIQFLIIKSTTYGDALSYKVNSETTAIKLNAAHVFMGTGAVSILNAAPAKLVFTNGLTGDVTLDLLIGIDAAT